MNSSVRKLPDAELEVMQAIWVCTPPVFRAEIEDLEEVQKSKARILKSCLRIRTPWLLPRC